MDSLCEEYGTIYKRIAGAASEVENSAASVRDKGRGKRRKYGVD
jgi:hypothetical protein